MKAKIIIFVMTYFSVTLPLPISYVVQCYLSESERNSGKCIFYGLGILIFVGSFSFISAFSTTIVYYIFEKLFEFKFQLNTITATVIINAILCFFSFSFFRGSSDFEFLVTSWAGISIVTSVIVYGVCKII